VSTFSGLNTAYSGLVAARLGLDVVGQNIANANTEGYTRQRLSTFSASPLGAGGRLDGGVRPGQGVSINGIQRLGSSQFDGQVRTTFAASGFSSVRANALSDLETSLHEPGDKGMSAQLQKFWGGWQDLSNRAGEAAPATLLLGHARELATQIATGYRSVTEQWSSQRDEVVGMVAELNSAATQVAELNGAIRSVLASGGSANELIDQRSALTTTIASLSGATVRELPDGTVDVSIGGNALVSGDRARTLNVVGSSTLEGAAADAVRLVWTNPATPASVEGGEIAGGLSVLAAANATGTGGPLAEAAVSYNAFATELATKVNAIHRTGATSTSPPGVPAGLDFFAFDPTQAALSLSVVPTDLSGIAAALPGSGAKNGGVADALAQLGAGKALDGLGVAITSPNAGWADFVTKVAVGTRMELQQAKLASLTATSALNRQLAVTTVDLDEENVNLLMLQHAYQGAARVMTAVDEMLDTLINRTGLVGR